MTANNSGTKCPKCDSTNFELVKDFPTNASWVMQYIRCSVCKSFLQALYVDNVSLQVKNLHEDVRKIKVKIGIP